MNDQELEAYLLASRPIDGVYGPFTQSIMHTIRSHYLPHHDKHGMWRNILDYAKQSTLRRVAALAVVILVTAFIGLSGYAYANGTNPFSLIKRWVVGEQVKVTYQDPQTNKQREFSHGAKRSYSDLAVSAFAEVSLIDLLHFHAANSYTVPKNGVEYIADPFRVEYIYPRVGTIERIDKENVVLHLTYSVGQSKMEPSRDISERITVPRAYFYYYKEGKLVAVQESLAGKLAVVYQDQYLRHKQRSGERPTPVDLYSAFVVSHSLSDIKEATTTKGSVGAKTDEELEQEISQQDIYELGVGDWSNVCSGNGADSCPHAFRDESGQNLFDARIVSGEDYGGSTRTNPHAIAFGEGVYQHTTQTRQYQLRHIEGKISAINDDKLTVKTPSGALWTFEYPVEYQLGFATAYNQPLKVGDLLAGGIIASVYDWDRRDFASQYVYGMSRYK